MHKIQFPENFVGEGQLPPISVREPGKRMEKALRSLIC